ALVGCVRTFGGDLTPASGRCAKIEHPGAGFENAILVVDFDKLEGGAGTETFAPGARYVRIVELPLQPCHGRHGAALPAPYPHLQLALTAAARAGGHAEPHTWSSRIICTSMPSRRPRSATRSRVQGKTRRIASRMAHPASTRSARSAPMHGLATRS